MKTDIILCGVGGQGILSIAAVIGTAALHEGLHIKQAEVHGMSQRGGAVQSHLRISEKEISSDLIPEGMADVILSVEPLEGLRYLPFLKKDGWLVTAQEPFENISNYPEREMIYREIGRLPNHLVIKANDLAAEAGSIKASNIVMLGAASPFINIREEHLISAIRDIFNNKGSEIVDLNIKAFDLGKTFRKQVNV